MELTLESLNSAYSRYRRWESSSSEFTLLQLPCTLGGLALPGTEKALADYFQAQFQPVNESLKSEDF
jgi:hypothetical protein